MDKEAGLSHPARGHPAEPGGSVAQVSVCHWCLGCGGTVSCEHRPLLACSGAWESLGCVCSLANAQCSFTGKCFNWKFPRLNWAQKVNADVP